MNNNLTLYLWHSLQSFPWMFFFLQLFASQMSCMLGFLNRIALILSCHMPSKAKPTKKSIIWYLIHVSEHLAISTEWVNVNFYSVSSMCLLLFFLNTTLFLIFHRQLALPFFLHCLYKEGGNIMDQARNACSSDTFQRKLSD